MLSVSGRPPRSQAAILTPEKKKSENLSTCRLEGMLIVVLTVGGIGAMNRLFR